MIGFGTTRDGRDVHAITLNAHGMSATVLTYGAILQDLRLDGMDHSLTLSSRNVQDFEDTMCYHGPVIGPVANRLRNAAAPIDGHIYTFDKNLNDTHTLHGGFSGAHAKLWTVQDNTPSSVTLSVDLPDTDGGFPGNRQITARFDFLEGPALRLTLTTTTDAPSIANATNHSYWNLDGATHMSGHTLRIAADSYLPTDADCLPTGEITPVAGTDFDFRTAKHLRPATPAMDNTFCVAHARGALTDRLWLTGENGLTMTVATTEAGVHIYDAASTNRPNCPPYEGIAIEAQGWPDAPNHATFPSIAITPDAPAVQITQWRFSR